MVEVVPEPDTAAGQPAGLSGQDVNPGCVRSADGAQPAFRPLEDRLWRLRADGDYGSTVVACGPAVDCESTLLGCPWVQRPVTCGAASGAMEL